METATASRDRRDRGVKFTGRRGNQRSMSARCSGVIFMTWKFLNHI